MRSSKFVLLIGRVGASGDGDSIFRICNSAVAPMFNQGQSSSDYSKDIGRRACFEQVWDLPYIQPMCLGARCRTAQSVIARHSALETLVLPLDAAAAAGVKN